MNWNRYLFSVLLNFNLNLAQSERWDYLLSCWQWYDLAGFLVIVVLNWLFLFRDDFTGMMSVFSSMGSALLVCDGLWENFLTFMSSWFLIVWQVDTSALIDFGPLALLAVFDVVMLCALYWDAFTVVSVNFYYWYCIIKFFTEILLWYHVKKLWWLIKLFIWKC
jgi:hypothetical protein